MNTHAPTNTTSVSVEPGTRIELVAGPLCGTVKRWPASDGVAGFAYYGGTAYYEYRGEETHDGRPKATHLHG